MAHFAELDENNTVLRVVVIGNKDTSDASGTEKEHIGAAFCERLFGGRWVQTSYNSNFRVRYAGPGMVFREDLNAFIESQPYPSWALNAETTEWEAPTPKPSDGNDYVWNESTTSWDQVQPE